ncbi:hypothetical protein KM043_018637 [Ampulex compressa]|nr:hypothetical protein KM043_018637 [Ampulex compressa]
MGSAKATIAAYRGEEVKGGFTTASQRSEAAPRRSHSTRATSVPPAAYLFGLHLVHDLLPHLAGRPRCHGTGRKSGKRDSQRPPCDDPARPRRRFVAALNEARTRGPCHRGRQVDVCSRITCRVLSPPLGWSLAPRKGRLPCRRTRTTAVDILADAAGLENAADYRTAFSGRRGAAIIGDPAGEKATRSHR